MIVRSLTGEDEINNVLMGGMEVTIGALVREGIISNEIGESFLSEHLIMVASADGGFRQWFKRMWPGFTESKIMVVRI